MAEVGSKGPEVQAKVAEHELFADLGPDEIDEILKATDGVKMSDDGSILMTEGERGDSLLLLLAGKVDVVKGLARGREHLLGTAESVDVLGELALLLDDPRVATVRASGPVSYVILKRDDFERLLESGSPAARRLLARIARSIARRHRESVETVANLLDEAKRNERKPHVDLSHLRARFSTSMRYNI